MENRRTTPCFPRAPNLLHVLPSRMEGWNNLCTPAHTDQDAEDKEYDDDDDDNDNDEGADCDDHVEAVTDLLVLLLLAIFLASLCEERLDTEALPKLWQTLDIIVIIIIVGFLTVFCGFYLKFNPNLDAHDEADDDDDDEDYNDDDDNDDGDDNDNDDDEDSNEDDDDDDDEDRV